MRVYLVWGWDSMASSWGDEYLAGVYGSQAEAQRVADALNRGKSEHQPKARIEIKEVQP